MTVPVPARAAAARGSSHRGGGSSGSGHRRPRQRKSQSRGLPRRWEGRRRDWREFAAEDRRLERGGIIIIADSRRRRSGGSGRSSRSRRRKKSKRRAAAAIATLKTTTTTAATSSMSSSSLSGRRARSRSGSADVLVDSNSFRTTSRRRTRRQQRKQEQDQDQDQDQEQDQDAVAVAYEEEEEIVGADSSSLGATGSTARIASNLSTSAAVAVAAELSAERLAAASSTSCPTALSRPLGTLRVLPTKAEIDVSIRLLAASLGGAAVGLERSSSDRPAGVRTMALVSLGAAAFTVCSMYGFLSVASSVSGAKFDPSRMASNVASGVGFIGAGVITNNRKAAGVYDRQSSVNGLTTAAAIWVSAAVGVACGVGLFVVGAAAALSTIAILRFGRVKNTGLGKGVLSIGTKRKKNTSASASTPASISRPTTSSSNATASLLNATSVSLSGKVGAEAPAALDPLLKAAKKRTPLAVAGDGLAARLMRDLVPSGANKDNSPPKSTGETLVREKSVEETRAPSTQEAGIDSAVKKKTGMKSNSTLPSRLDRGQRKVTEKRSQKLVDPLLEKYLWGDDGEERKEPATTFEGLPIPPYVPPTSFPESGAPADAEYEGAGQEMVNARRRPAPNGGGRSSGASEKLSDSG
mmetsp:Transcript_21679/g.48486  ORF Transcript_21679/g.48486 Transcript_21679/m.48486 type:complete len:639 (-) Transcript_21679:68-1984(-)